LSQTAQPSQTDKNINFKATGLEPSVTYYFKLESIDSAGRQSIYQTSYATSGFPVKITLAGTGLDGREVTINDTTFKTDKTGSISAFLSPGDYLVTDKKSKVDVSITVSRQAARDGVLDEQNFKLYIPASNSLVSRIGPTRMFAGLAVLLIGAIGFLVLRWLKGGEISLASKGYADAALPSDPRFVVSDVQHGPAILPAAHPENDASPQLHSSLAKLFTPKHRK
jgi:hypothetical protein